MRRQTALYILANLCWWLAAGCSRQSGIVLDKETKKPVAYATIFHNGRSTVSGSDGTFVLKKVDWEQPVLVKASGFRQTKVTLVEGTPCAVQLQPFDARGIYLSYHGVGAAVLREPALKLIDETALNALVVEIKADDGAVSFQWDVPLAEEIGAMKRPTIGDIELFIQELHDRNIYVIGRMAVFKDGLLGKKKPEWAITDLRTKKPYAEKDKAAWVDPFRQEVRDYNLSLAVAAAQAGFDEIQFDYIRFPVQTGQAVARYAKENTSKNRVRAIHSFLRQAHEALRPYNVYLAIDVFGLTCWHEDESELGQQIRTLALWADYVCPMVYPSGFHTGFSGLSEAPVTIPREVIAKSMQNALPMLEGQSKKLRPWLQNFRDYSFDRRQFTEKEIALQIRGAEETGTSGWMLWDASNRYKFTTEALNLVESGFPTNLASVAAEASVYE